MQVQTGEPDYHGGLVGIRPGEGHGEAQSWSRVGQVVGVVLRKVAAVVALQV